MDALTIFASSLLAVLLLGNGIYLLRRHSIYPDTSIGVRSKAARKNENSWEKSNRCAGKSRTILGLVLLLGVSSIFCLGVTGWQLITAGAILATIAIFLAFWLPANAIRQKGSNPYADSDR